MSDKKDGPVYLFTGFLESGKTKFIQETLEDKRIGFQKGADDYMVKPVDEEEMLLRIQALLRRAYNYAPVSNVIEHKGAILNVENASLTYQGKKVSLSKNEFRILQYLLEKKGQVVSREKLMERLWETDSFVDENTLSVNVNRLREKLEAAGLSGFITTKFGVGYLIE